MSKAKSKRDPEERLRKIGQREETIIEKLSQLQIEDERGKVCELVRAKDELEAKRKSVNSDYKAKISDIDSKIKNALGCVNSGRRETETIVEEWLTHGNEVVRVRADTGDQLGRRNARAEELQEELFQNGEDSAATDQAIAETAADARDAGDFGDAG